MIRNRRRLDRAGDAAPALLSLPTGQVAVATLSPWLNYQEAAVYCLFSVGHLRNLVSADQIPVYGKPRMRRFRRDMLDLYLTDPDAALRKFRSERNTHGG